MTIVDLRNVLKKIHKDFDVVKANEKNKTASVLFRGVYQFAVPADGIYEDPNDDYGITTPSGVFVRHRTVKEAVHMAKGLIDKMKYDTDNYEAAMGIGKYSDAALAASDDEMQFKNPDKYRLS